MTHFSDAQNVQAEAKEDAKLARSSLEGVGAQRAWLGRSERRSGTPPLVRLPWYGSPWYGPPCTAPLGTDVHFVAGAPIGGGRRACAQGRRTRRGEPRRSPKVELRVAALLPRSAATLSARRRGPHPSSSMVCAHLADRARDVQAVGAALGRPFVAQLQELFRGSRDGGISLSGDVRIRTEFNQRFRQRKAP